MHLSENNHVNPGFFYFLRDQFFCLLSMVILLILAFSNCLVIFTVYLYLYSRTSVSTLQHVLWPAFGNSGRETGHAAGTCNFSSGSKDSVVISGTVSLDQEPTSTALVSKKATLLPTTYHKLVRLGSQPTQCIKSD